jgi:excisionase family DNA binding protein
MTNGVRYLTTGQVAKACQVSLMAVKKWIRQGKLKAFQTPGGHFRISTSEFKRFQAVHRFPLEPEEPERVLIVDDDPLIVGMLLEALRSTRPALKLEAASNGYEGLLKVGTFRPHLLVLDLRMPELDGFEVCRRIKGDSATQATKILAITAYPEESAKEEALRCGADAFLAKPFAIEELEAQVGRLIEPRE